METKKCKYCQTDISKAAKVCPQCGRKQGGKLKWILLGLVVLFVLGGMFGSKGDKEESSSTSDTTEETSSKPAKKEKKDKKIAYTEYSVTELSNDLEANALSASDKYKDQYVELTGRLGAIDSDGSYISLLDPEDEWDMLGVQCYIKNDDQLNVVKSLTKDSKVRVKGKITDVGEVMGYSLDIDEISAEE